MTSLDNLLEQISPELPCGENLEYSAGFLAMEQASKGKPERAVGDKVFEAEEPDWKEVRAKALELLEKTRDLRVASLLARALLQTDGFDGFASGLALIRGYLENRWEEVHPLLDPEDGRDPTARVNAIGALASLDVTMGGLRRAPLVSSAIGKFNYRDFMIARGQVAPSPDETKHDLKLIESAFMNCGLEELQQRHNSVVSALESIAAMEAFFVQAIGPNQAPDLSALTEVLKPIQAVLQEYLGRRGAAEGVIGAMEPGVSAANGGGWSQGGIQNREDAGRALEAVAEYFARHEPSSPVPLLLRRAKRLMSKDFLAIVRDLAPDGVKQAESIRGADSEG